MEISKIKLEKCISEAIKELRNAAEYDNGYRVKIYLHGDNLGHEVIQSNWQTPNFDYIFSFPYIFPYYGGDSRGSVPYMIESGQFENEESITSEDVKEWDWNMFCEAEIFHNVERLLYEAIEKIENESEHILIN